MTLSLRGGLEGEGRGMGLRATPGAPGGGGRPPLRKFII